jgi:hypothetical protein
VLKFSLELLLKWQVVNFIEVLNPIQHQIFSTFSNESYEERRNDVENLEESLGSSAALCQQLGLQKRKVKNTSSQSNNMVKQTQICALCLSVLTLLVHLCHLKQSL